MQQRVGKYSPANAIRSDSLPSVRGSAIHLPAQLEVQGGPEQWTERVSDSNAIVAVDLFCGCGGLSLGFNNAGMFVAAGIDSDPIACETHAANFLSRTLCLNLTTVDPTLVIEQLGLPRVDVVMGGPPCQGFSVLGRARVRKLSQEQQEEIFAQNELYRHFFQLIEVMQPLIFVMENVPEFALYQSGHFYRAVLAECARLGYEPYEDVLLAADFGVPQARRRMFIVGSRIGRGFLWPGPTHATRPISLREAIGDLPAVHPPQLNERLPYHPETSSEYVSLMRVRVPQEDSQYIYDHVMRPVRDDDREIFTHMRPGSYYRDIDPRYQRYNPHFFHDRYYMLDPDRPSISVTAHMAKDGYRYIHWDTAQHRTLSVREAARIQSFDDDFRFVGYRSNRYRQIGNAVPPLLAQAIGCAVQQAILRYRAGNTDGIWQLGLPGFEHRNELVRGSAG